MMATADYPARLSAMLGLVPWRLRRDVAVEIAQAVEKKAPEMPVFVEEISAAPVVASEQAYTPMLALAEDVRVWAADNVTIISMSRYGSWWLPALSLRDKGMQLFRSRVEMEMLQAMLTAAALHAPAKHFLAVDAYFAANGLLATRLPPNAEELVSLPKPWVLCGAIAGRQGKALAGEYTPLFLHHPLQLLQSPQHKRHAWQQLLAYRQVIHV